MMFRGPYRTPFYRRLHKLLHKDLELRRNAYGHDEADVREQLDQLEAEWREWAETEPYYRNPDATLFSRSQRPSAARRGEEFLLLACPTSC